MNWIDFGSGFIAAALMFALFSDKGNRELVEGTNEDDEEIVNRGTFGRSVTMMCATCRKLKRHKEIEPNLFQCARCQRHVDLRVTH